MVLTSTIRRVKSACAPSGSKIGAAWRGSGGFLRAPAGPISWNCFGHNELNDWRRASRSAAMRLHTHRSHPSSIALVIVTVSALLVEGYACALVALWAH